VTSSMESLKSRRKRMNLYITKKFRTLTHCPNSRELHWSGESALKSRIRKFQVRIFLDVLFRLRLTKHPLCTGMISKAALRRGCVFKEITTQTKVITLKTQLHAVNACVKRSSQRSFIIIIIKASFIMGYEFHFVLREILLFRQTNNFSFD